MREHIMKKVSNVNRVIILNCFGRGGSSILWNMIGCSPDVLMTGREWHRGFYGRLPVLGRALRRATRPWGLDVPLLPGLPALAGARVLQSIPAQERTDKPAAGTTVIKLMDHHLCMNRVIDAAFEQTEQIILMRHPVAQCESLARSGLATDQAISWYADVCERFLRLTRQPNVHLVKFEDMVRDPFAVRDRLYSTLGIALPASGGIRFKRKKFGDQRTANEPAVGDYVEMTRENVADLLDPRVNEKSLARVPRERQDYIWSRVADIAAQLGYSPEEPEAVALDSLAEVVPETGRVALGG